MGVHYLIRNLENINGRLPFKLTFNSENNFRLESDAYLESYKEIGSGNLNYIGFDGSTIIHSKVKYDNEKKCVNIIESAQDITMTILTYIEAIMIFFNFFNKIKIEENKKEKKKQPLILHFVIDGIPPCKKNRPKFIDSEGNESFKKDEYSQMSFNDKKKLHKKIIKFLKQSIKSFNNNNNNNNYNKYEIKLLTNYNMSDKDRGEGEIELYKVCQLLNKQPLKNSVKNVIVSSDSDVISLMLMHQDKNLVVISPLVKNIYITNYNVLTNALNLTTECQVIKYVLLHFIFFGSDYSVGLMSNPNDSKQQAIFNGVKVNSDYIIDQIGQNCPRKRKKENSDCYFSNADTDAYHKFLQKLKDLIIYEGICAFMYYFDIIDGKKYLLNYSPRLYEISETKQYIPLIKF